MSAHSEALDTASRARSGLVHVERAVEAAERAYREALLPSPGTRTSLYEQKDTPAEARGKLTLAKEKLEEAQAFLAIAEERVAATAPMGTEAEVAELRSLEAAASQAAFLDVVEAEVAAIVTLLGQLSSRFDGLEAKLREQHAAADVAINRAARLQRPTSVVRIAKAVLRAKVLGRMVQTMGLRPELAEWIKTPSDSTTFLRSLADYVQDDGYSAFFLSDRGAPYSERLLADVRGTTSLLLAGGVRSLVTQWQAEDAAAERQRKLEADARELAIAEEQRVARRREAGVDAF